MKYNSYKQVCAILLLLLYTFSNSPFIKFHHHNSSQESYSITTIENGVSGFQSNSELHQLEKRCALCDNHTLSAHASSVFITENISTLNYSISIPSATIHNYSKIIPYTNRGPPEVSFASV
ncbi:MAG: hypothetical protein KA954_08765 [Chitinophagales bacterium]|nr:hypothetical protein [Chitinophagales bacterium]MBP9190822.1 hypothetical protein [Chitinophagales bacterium]MBP9705917.1 hypothetical protein [Chitinophagales bacterium]